MNKNEIISTVSSKFSKLGFKVKKHSPEILVVSGVIGVVTAAVMACKATTKVSEIIEKAKDDIDIIHGAVEGNIPTKEPYTEDDANKAITMTYMKVGLKLVKLYAPAVVIGGLSVRQFYIQMVFFANVIWLLPLHMQQLTAVLRTIETVLLIVLVKKSKRSFAIILNLSPLKQRQLTKAVMKY